mmetsp:Transcript_10822/g.22511  ORF Transcript_10822/g.22511 Transcript_10822/m.22511 type:complete len:228 (+) Transcript_10822:1545-2228(+)
MLIISIVNLVVLVVLIQCVSSLFLLFLVIIVFPTAIVLKFLAKSTVVAISQLLRQTHRGHTRRNTDPSLRRHDASARFARGDVVKISFQLAHAKGVDAIAIAALILGGPNVVVRRGCGHGGAGGGGAAGRDYGSYVAPHADAMFVVIVVVVSVVAVVTVAVILTVIGCGSFPGATATLEERVQIEPVKFLGCDIVGAIVAIVVAVVVGLRTRAIGYHGDNSAKFGWC